MTIIVDVTLSALLSLLAAWIWSGAIERGVTVAPRLPVARLTRRQRRNLRAMRADLRSVLP